MVQDAKPGPGNELSCALVKKRNGGNTLTVSIRSKPDAAREAVPPEGEQGIAGVFTVKRTGKCYVREPKAKTESKEAKRMKATCSTVSEYLRG